MTIMTLQFLVSCVMKNCRNSALCSDRARYDIRSLKRQIRLLRSIIAIAIAVNDTRSPKHQTAAAKRQRNETFSECSQVWLDLPTLVGNDYGRNIHGETKWDQVQGMQLTRDYDLKNYGATTSSSAMRSHSLSSANKDTLNGGPSAQ